MHKRLTESELCTTAWDLLKERFGPAEAMRFLSLIRTCPRDYQKWRERHFKGLTPDQAVEGMKGIQPQTD